MQALRSLQQLKLFPRPLVFSVYPMRIGIIRIRILSLSSSLVHFTHRLGGHEAQFSFNVFYKIFV